MCILYKHHTVQCDSLICSVTCMWDIYNQKCCTFNLHPTAKVLCLTHFYISFLSSFFSPFYMKLKEYRTKMYAFLHHLISQDHQCPHASRSLLNRVSHVRKIKLIPRFYSFFIFPFVRYVCSVVQNHVSASHAGCGNRTAVRKTSLPSKPYCCRVSISACFCVCMLNPKSAETWNGKRWICAGSVGLT